MEITSFFTGAFVGVFVMFLTMLLSRRRLDEDVHFHHHFWMHADDAEEEIDPADAWKDGTDEDP